MTSFLGPMEGEKSLPETSHEFPEELCCHRWGNVGDSGPIPHTPVSSLAATSQESSKTFLKYVSWHCSLSPCCQVQNGEILTSKKGNCGILCTCRSTKLPATLSALDFLGTKPNNDKIWIRRDLPICHRSPCNHLPRWEGLWTAMNTMRTTGHQGKIRSGIAPQEIWNAALVHNVSPSVCEASYGYLEGPRCRVKDDRKTSEKGKEKEIVK